MATGPGTMTSRDAARRATARAAFQIMVAVVSRIVKAAASPTARVAAGPIVVAVVFRIRKGAASRRGALVAVVKAGEEVGQGMVVAFETCVERPVLGMLGPWTLGLSPVMLLMLAVIRLARPGRLATCYSIVLSLTCQHASCCALCERITSCVIGQFWNGSGGPVTGHCAVALG